MDKNKLVPDDACMGCRHYRYFDPCILIFFESFQEQEDDKKMYQRCLRVDGIWYGGCLKVDRKLFAYGGVLR